MRILLQAPLQGHDAVISDLAEAQQSTRMLQQPLPRVSCSWGCAAVQRMVPSVAALQGLSKYGSMACFDTAAEDQGLQLPDGPHERALVLLFALLPRRKSSLGKLFTNNR